MAQLLPDLKCHSLLGFDREGITACVAIQPSELTCCEPRKLKGSSVDRHHSASHGEATSPLVRTEPHYHAALSPASHHGRAHLVAGRSLPERAATSQIIPRSIDSLLTPHAFDKRS